MRYQHLALALVFVGVGSMTAVSDEGMWLLNDAPKQQLKEKYKFDLTDAWLKNAMLASVRLNSGGSGGFVSPDGLLVTNHHVAADSLDKTRLRSDVVTLYNGGLYHLYRYKKYTDVRLVFAPERQIASFGGDVDNFEYPRMNLDVAFFRAYEDGKPVKTPNFFKWSETGPAGGDLVFVTGHPGTTNRLETLAKLKHRRDVTLPYTLYRLRTLEAALSQYAEQGPEQHRQAATDHHRVANARKAFSGQLQGLLDPKIIRQKQEQERDLSQRLSSLPGPGPGPGQQQL